MSLEIFSFLQKLLVNRPFLVWTAPCASARASLRLLLAPMALPQGCQGRELLGRDGLRGELQPHISSGSTTDVMSDQSPPGWRQLLLSARSTGWRRSNPGHESVPVLFDPGYSTLAVVWNAAFAAMAQVLARVSSFSAESAVWMIKKFWKKYSGISVCSFGRSF